MAPCPQVHGASPHQGYATPHTHRSDLCHLVEMVVVNVDEHPQKPPEDLLDLHLKVLWESSFGIWWEQLLVVDHVFDPVH